MPPDRPQANPLSRLNLPSRIEGLLEAHGIRTVEELVNLPSREVSSLPGIGPKALAVIEKALVEGGLSWAEDAWGPYTCARHAEPSWDTTLQSLFLCPECRDLFRDQPFRGTPPEYVGPAVPGYCLHCNRRFDDIRLSQWYLCTVCDRVVRSIGRSVAADDSVLAWWRENVASELPHLELRLTDPPELQSRERDREPRIGQPDFTCTDTAAAEVLFGIELKTGRSYVGRGSIGSKMQQFQLDHSDCDEIVEVVRRDEIPVYLAHAQVIDRADPPTLRYVAIGLWWTDLFAMSEHYRESRRRPRETRRAAYYSTDMFRGMEDFIEHLRAGGPHQMKERLVREGTPNLYES
jgi:hypothetical protein